MGATGGMTLEVCGTTGRIGSATSFAPRTCRSARSHGRGFIPVRRPTRLRRAGDASGPRAPPAARPDPACEPASAPNATGDQPAPHRRPRHGGPATYAPSPARPPAARRPAPPAAQQRHARPSAGERTGWHGVSVSQEEPPSGWMPDTSTPARRSVGLRHSVPQARLADIRSRRWRCYYPHRIGGHLPCFNCSASAEPRHGGAVTPRIRSGSAPSHRNWKAVCLGIVTDVPATRRVSCS